MVYNVKLFMINKRGLMLIGGILTVILILTFDLI